MKTFKQLREDGAVPVNVAGVPGTVSSMQGSPTMAGIDKMLGGGKMLRRKPLTKIRKK
jgi:hypothetical protein